MTGKKHLAFDLGASSGRAIVGWIEDGTLRLREVHRFPNHPYEQDGRFFWDFATLTKELESGLQKAFGFAPDLATFSVDTWGVDAVFFRDGKPIRQPYAYRDPRFRRAQEDVHKIISGRELYAATGIQLLEFNTVYQLFADAQDHPEDFRSGAKMLMMPDALLAVLTGEMTSEYTIASTGALLDPYTREWKTELFEKLNLPTDILTKIVPPCTLGAPLKEEISRRLGVPRIPSVKCCSHDTASAVAALPTREIAKDAYISLGTWALLGAEIIEPNLSDAAYQAGYTHEGGLAGTLRFLTNITGTWLLQETRRTWQEAGENITFSEMCDLAKSVKTEKRIDPDDKAFALPGNMPERIAAYCREHGQGEFTSRAELLRCIYDSLADCFAGRLLELEKLRHTEYAKLHILGGGTKDDFLMQLTANRIGKSVVAGPVEATAIGNLLSQLLAAGEIRSLPEGRALVAASFETKEYQPEK